MLKEFRVFIARGNVLDLAVAVILGGAFNAIVTSLVNDIIMPIIGILSGGIDFSQYGLAIGSAVIAYGKFIQAILNFVIVAFALFLMVRTYNRFRRKEEPKKPATPADIVLLTEIRDLLKQNASVTTTRTGEPQR